MKKNIDKELDSVSAKYNEVMVGVFLNLMKSINTDKYEIISECDFDIFDFFKRCGYYENIDERIVCYEKGLKSDLQYKEMPEDGRENFGVKITSKLLHGNALMDFYKFAVLNNYDIRLLNHYDSVFLYFYKIPDKKYRMPGSWRGPKKYGWLKPWMGYSADKPYYYENPKMVFENFIEKVNWQYNVLIIVNYIHGCDCWGQYDCWEHENCPSKAGSVYKLLNKFFLAKSSILEFLKPAMDHGGEIISEYNMWVDIENEEYNSKKEHIEIEGDGYVDDFLDCFMMHDGKINANIYKDCYKQVLQHPLPFSMIDYKLLSTRESEDKIIYIYRLAAFADANVLCKIFSLYYFMKSKCLNISFFVKSIYLSESEREHGNRIFKATKCENAYLKLLFDNLRDYDIYGDYSYCMDYKYNEEYINFFFCITEYKDKKSWPEAVSYIEEAKKEEEKMRKEEEEVREAYERERDYEEDNRNFIRSMDRDFPGWGWNFD